MYNLLIVDDEPLITDGLYDFFVENSELELEICRAYSGREALDWMNRIRIDIVLTDISMPDITGLEVQKQITKIWPECVVIFLTSFNEFEYVQTAMQHGGTDYILKTTCNDEVLSAVKKGVAKIDLLRKNEALLNQAKLNLSLALPFMQAKFLNDLAEGWDYSPEETKKQLNELNIPLKYDLPIFMLLAHIDYWPDGISVSEKMKLMYSLNNTLENFFCKSSYTLSTVFERSKILMLLQPIISIVDENDQIVLSQKMDNLSLFIKGSMDSIQNVSKDLFNLSVSFAVINEPFQWHQFSDKFDVLLLKFHKETGISNQMLLIDSSNNNKPDVYDSDSNEQIDMRSQLRKISLLRTYLDNVDSENFFKLFDDIMETLSNCVNDANDIKAEVYYLMAGLFISYLNHWKMTEGFEDKHSLAELVGMKGHATWEESVSFFKSLAENIFRKKSDDSFKHANYIFKFIKTYTEQHLSDDLSLTKFSDLLNFHPFYLSRLFKQVTSMNFSEYITDVKVKKAIDMLENSNMKINEIAKALGFRTSSYFTKFFRKSTGKSPVEFRKTMDP